MCRAREGLLLDACKHDQEYGEFFVIVEIEKRIVWRAKRTWKTTAGNSFPLELLKPLCLINH